MKNPESLFLNPCSLRFTFQPRDYFLFVPQKFCCKIEIFPLRPGLGDAQFIMDLSGFSGHQVDPVGEKDRFVNIVRDQHCGKVDLPHYILIPALHLAFRDGVQC